MAKNFRGLLFAPPYIVCNVVMAAGGAWHNGDFSEF